MRDVAEPQTDTCADGDRRTSKWDGERRCRLFRHKDNLSLERLTTYTDSNVAGIDNRGRVTLGSRRLLSHPRPDSDGAELLPADQCGGQSGRRIELCCQRLPRQFTGVLIDITGNENATGGIGGGSALNTAVSRRSVGP